MAASPCQENTAESNRFAEEKCLFWLVWFNTLQGFQGRFQILTGRSKRKGSGKNQKVVQIPRQPHRLLTERVSRFWCAMLRVKVW